VTEVGTSSVGAVEAPRWFRARAVPRFGPTWWTAWLFMVGSSCFAVAALPGFASAVPDGVPGVVFFVGSIFFTSAGFSQLSQAMRPRWRTDRGMGRILQVRSIDWWACVVQSAGTLWFNLNTYDAMQSGLSVHEQNLRIWTPDMIGSICFLVASELAIWSVCRCAVCIRHHDVPWRIAVINMTGSVFFMLSAIAALVLPSTSSLLDASVANSGTVLGALCFFWGARLLLLVPDAD